jgi:ADP-ribose pyrophosphatase YjhB (NUDIX family)
MRKTLLLAGALSATAVAQADGGLTELEQRWLRLGWPAVTYAKSQGLPLDIIVQPQPTPGLAPLAMAYVEGRCKLVLSMRGNPEAESTLANIPAALLNPVVEAMAAHEMGHCWRYVRGAWHTVPAGFSSTAREIDDAALREQWQAMQQTRLEEAYADLVGLAWTQRQHPHAYAAVHAWFVAFRDDGAHPGHHHDTLAWVKLAADPRAFASADTPFEQAWPLWQRGLRATPEPQP